MVMRDFNASVSDKLHGVVGPYGLGIGDISMC